MRKIFLLFSLVSTLILSGCGMLGGSEIQKLTVTDIDPAFGAIGKILTIDGVEFETIGNPVFDDFFREAAKINGLVALTNSFTNSVTSNMKKIAMNSAADAEFEKQYQEITKGRPLDSLSGEEVRLVYQLMRDTKKLSDQDLNYYLDLGKNSLALVATITKTISTAPELLNKGQALVSQVSSLDPLKVPAATSAVAKSVENLASFVANSPKMVADLTVLVGALTQ